ncbi:retropepsin-like aspartic protease family protein [Actinomadura scrupuli]|uniref:retropepsin-like aspartic protease family protein n=1 Tax=Actinomadura scrupuli TaxID=559629 RepID=UPI003D97FEAA
MVAIKALWVTSALAGALVLGLGGCAFGPRAGAAPAQESLKESLTPAPRKSPKYSGVRATRPAGGGTSIPIRVTVDNGATLVMVPIKVNGRGPFQFILDTGASTSTLDRSLMRRLKLPRTGQTARIQGVTGRATVPVVRIRSWSLGGQPLSSRSLTVINMGDPNIAGLLGSDELRRFGRVTVDYQQRRLILRGR